MSGSDKNKTDDIFDGFENATEKAREAASQAGDAAEEAARNIKESWNELRESKDNKRVLAGILAIVIGGFGLHKFVLGYNKEGIMLLAGTFILGIITFGLFAWAIWVVTLVEGIIYLTKSDAEFYHTYQENKRPWF
ncbi:TM2 domain-containing protein [Gilvibacter sediminis]|uniref:TM2 domain-containing protein n=1 Tax=Gilvibacter sediminis TaxID=379071 RepID=UPI002350C284|nr:TM2 domain-containing protein [Gilvibacter sediminis]MDC7996572.1 TM2 domain-containing protein [Gilvibacter sediminis]